MLIAAAVRAPTSVAIALFTLAVSAASLVNSVVVRLVSSALFDAQAESASTSAAMMSLVMTCPSREPAPARGRPAVAGRTATSPVAASPFPLHPRFPVLHLALGLVLLDAIALLDLADQLVAVARHLV